MKYELMLKILYLLLSKKKVSAAYIARRFEISTRTAFRYLTAISLANIPLIAEPGRILYRGIVQTPRDSLHRKGIQRNRFHARSL